MVLLCGREVTDKSFQINNPSVGHGKEISTLLKMNRFFLRSLKVSNICFSETTREIFKGLETNKTVKTLILESIRLDEKTSESFFQVFKFNNTLEALEFSSVSSKPDFYEQLFKILKTKKNVQSLSISKTILSMNDQKELEQYLKVENSISSLTLKNLKFESEELLISSILASKYLSSLNLELKLTGWENFLKKMKLKELTLDLYESAEVFTQMLFPLLTDNDKLVKLRVSSSAIRELDGEQIGKLFETNKTLKSLILPNGEFQFKESKLLLEGLEKNSTLVECTLNLNDNKISKDVEQIIERNKKLAIITTHFAFGNDFNTSFFFH